MWLDSDDWLQELAQNMDRLTIEQLLELHEVFLGPLSKVTKRRIVRAAAVPTAVPEADRLPVAIPLAA